MAEHHHAWVLWEGMQGLECALPTELHPLSVTNEQQQSVEASIILTAQVPIKSRREAMASQLWGDTGRHSWPCFRDTGLTLLQTIPT